MKISQGDVFRRREQLIERLHQKEHLTVSELADYFNVSAVTIRRDLLFLEKKKMIERFYGGVKLVSSQQVSRTEKVEKSSFPVAAFIEKLSPFLENRLQLFVGAGVFSTEIIHALSVFDVTILTNDAAALSIDHPKQKALISVSGGELEKNTQALVGDFATHSFNKVEADLCIIEAAGFNTHEVTTKTLNESFVYRTMIQHTKGPKIVYTPASNLETVSSFMIDRTFLFDILYTDASIPASLLSNYQSQSITVDVLTE
jgi:DeoR family transcriptional regulator of aga operon